MPATFESPHFAMKGGTALNLFLHDMPRLSVDIDVAYSNRALPRAEALHDISQSLRTVAEKLTNAGMRVQQIKAALDPKANCSFTRGKTVVKIEVNTVLRGTVLAVESRELVPAAQKEFKKYVEVPTLATSELYGGKLVAALDRQHPRDLFDATLLLRTKRGITKEILQCFVIYLASHNRPTHELLDPKRKDIDALFKNELEGMTRGVAEARRAPRNPRRAREASKRGPDQRSAHVPDYPDGRRTPLGGIGNRSRFGVAGRPLEAPKRPRPQIEKFQEAPCHG